MEHILVVDGSNLLFQMFYGMPARIPGPGDRDIRGTLGFVGALLKILRRVRPSHAVVAFDGECLNPRSELDESYKANREDLSQIPEEETPFSQLPDIYAALDALGIPHAETADCEADDWIAGYARRYGGEASVTVVSQDSDLFQLITENVRVLRYRGENSVLWGPETVLERLGIRPEQYADFKSLTGDPSDNIRGADKIGPKTAAQLLQQFGTLEGVLAGAGAVKKPSIRESLVRNQDRVRLNYRLIRLTGDAPLPFALGEMVFEDRGLSTMEVLRDIGLR